MTVTPNQLLIKALRTEIGSLRRIREEAVVNRADFSDRSPSSLRDLRGIAGNLADIYQAAENALQRIARSTGEGVPSGHNWHRELLDQMSRDVPKVRPAVLQEETRAVLEPYRSFRHLMRHRYGFKLEWLAMKPLLTTALKAIDALIDDLESFCSSLEQMM